MLIASAIYTLFSNSTSPTRKRRLDRASILKIMDSTVIISIIPNEAGVATREKNFDKEDGVVPKDNNFQSSLHSIVSFLKVEKSDENTRNVIHSIKVGIALVLVSLLYLLNPLYNQVGENAMWAIMTVVVVFEFFAGATLSKGLNRGIGTIFGGALGCLAAVLAQKLGGMGNAIVVGVAVFIFGAAATYCRMIPSIKRRYDYGVMIFILTFNLVAVSGLRAEKVMQLARERLLTIGMGFGVCLCTSLVVFPIWASDELHDSMASKFEILASSIQGCIDEYFKLTDEKGNQAGSKLNSCKSVLQSKAKEELLGNFARWEPWHGKFGFSHPWDKYLRIGEVLRELAATILSLESCLKSPRQASSNVKQLIKEQCQEVSLSLAWTLKELGESLMKMRRCWPTILILPKLQSMRVELSQVMSHCKLGAMEGADELAVSNLVFLLMEVVEKAEELAKEVEELGQLAGFHTK